MYLFLLSACILEFGFLVHFGFSLLFFSLLEPMYRHALVL